MLHPDTQVREVPLSIAIMALLDHNQGHLLALLATTAAESEVDANRELLSKVCAMLETKVFPDVQQSAQDIPVQAEAWKEMLFPAGPGLYGDSGIQMVDLLYLGRKTFITHSPWAWSAEHGLPVYGPGVGLTSVQLKRAEERCTAAEALLPMSFLEQVALEFRQDRRAALVDILTPPSALSESFTTQRMVMVNTMLLSELELGPQRTEVHKRDALSGVWEDHVGGRTLNEKYEERRRLMQEAMLPVAWRHASPADARDAVLAESVVQRWPGFWPQVIHPYPDLSERRYKRALQLHRAATLQLDPYLKAALASRERDPTNENPHDLA